MGKPGIAIAFGGQAKPYFLASGVDIDREAHRQANDVGIREMGEAYPEIWVKYTITPCEAFIKEREIWEKCPSCFSNKNKPPSKNSLYCR